MRCMDGTSRKVHQSLVLTCKISLVFAHASFLFPPIPHHNNTPTPHYPQNYHQLYCYALRPRYQNATQCLLLLPRTPLPHSRTLLGIQPHPNPSITACYASCVSSRTRLPAFPPSSSPPSSSSPRASSSGARSRIAWLRRIAFAAHGAHGTGAGRDICRARQRHAQGRSQRCAGAVRGCAADSQSGCVGRDCGTGEGYAVSRWLCTITSMRVLR
jgi:hypothetical protein